jgi:hypothetical protein
VLLDAGQGLLGSCSPISRRLRYREAAVPFAFQNRRNRELIPAKRRSGVSRKRVHGLDCRGCGSDAGIAGRAVMKQDEAKGVR